jgi:hypothetical protein
MPKLSVWFMRAALISLLLGSTFGALLLWNKGMPIHPMIWRLLPAHMELLLVGWMVQLAFGVAFWILPRWQSSRGDVRPVWAAFICLNAGIVLVAIAPFAGGGGWMQTVGRLLEMLAAGAFAIHAWPRAKPWFEPT